MFQSFFESPEISSIFIRKETDKKIKTRINRKYDSDCAECSRLQMCKQSRKRDRNLKKAKTRAQHQQRESTAMRSNKHKSNMEDMAKLAMLNEDNVYYDFDEEKGIVVEKKHSVVNVHKHATRTKIAAACNESCHFDSSSLLGETLPELCLELNEEQFIDGSCPSDSAYDTTHDELTESLERLTFADENAATQEPAFDESFGLKPPLSQHDSPYRRCRSRAICGRNCELCRGSNKNIITPKRRNLDELLEEADTQINQHQHRIPTQNIDEYRFDTGDLYKAEQNGISVDSMIELDESQKEFTRDSCIKQQSCIGGHRTKENDEAKSSPRSQTFTSNDALLREDGRFAETNSDAYETEKLRQMFSSGPHLIMLYDFKAEHEDDVTALKGDVVLLLDNRDMDWVWVMTQDYEEGYVPKSLTMQHLDCEECARQELLQPRTPPPTSKSNTTRNSSAGKVTPVLSNGIKMIAISSFETTEKGKLCVTKGDEIVISLKDQKIPEWLWAYSPRQRAYGYIPEHLVDALEVSSV